MTKKKTEAEIKEAYERQRAYIAKTTGAFEHPDVPPKQREEVTGVRAKLDPGLPDVQALIAEECDALKALLLEKNAGYGNSALDPVRTFSKASAVEQILVRVDDKLSRIKRGDLTKVKDEPLKQTVRDLQGYLALLQVAWRLGLE